jgi:hypothetical protein
LPLVVVNRSYNAVIPSFLSVRHVKRPPTCMHACMQVHGEADATRELRCRLRCISVLLVLQRRTLGGRRRVRYLDGDYCGCCVMHVHMQCHESSEGAAVAGGLWVGCGVRGCDVGFGGEERRLFVIPQSCWF